MNQPSAASCQICHSRDLQLLRRAALVRPALAELIQQQIGVFDDNGWICLDDLQQLQQRYVQQLLEAEKGELSALEQEVLQGLKNQEILAHNPEAEFEQELSIGQRMADRIATFGGSWYFIIIFAALLIGWMLVNSWLLSRHPFDPYPYILLNLVLSTLAAIQAPVIMMSQNRQEARDRARALHDYQINLKAELEIRQLHQKIDHLLSRQWERLVEIQSVQLDLMTELRQRK